MGSYPPGYISTFQMDSNYCVTTSIQKSVVGVHIIVPVSLFPAGPVSHSRSATSQGICENHSAVGCDESSPQTSDAFQTCMV